MASLNTINLIRSKTTAAPGLDALSLKLLAARLFVVVGFLAVCIVVGFVYVIINRQKQMLVAQNNELVAQIEQDKTKEGLYVALKQRVSVVRSALSQMKSVGDHMDVVVAAAPPPTLSSLRQDEAGKTTFSLKAQSLDVFIDTVNAFVLAAASSGIINNPELISFHLRREGSIEAVISFGTAL